MILCLHALDEKSGHGRRRFAAGAGHQIDDGFVAFVPDASDHGEGKLRNIARQLIIFEAIEICRGTSAANDDDGVPLVELLCDGIQGRNDTLRDVGTLHLGGKELQDEGIGRLLDLVAEITVACSIFRADHGNALRKTGQGNLLVERKNPVFHELIDDLLPSSSEFAECKFAVQVNDVERIAIDFVETDVHTSHDFEPLVEVLARFALKSDFKSLPRAVPDVGVCFCAELSGAAFVFFDELQVAVSVRRLTHLSNFGHDPETVHECEFQRLANDGIELIERECGGGFEVLHGTGIETLECKYNDFYAISQRTGSFSR